MEHASGCSCKLCALEPKEVLELLLLGLRFGIRSAEGEMMPKPEFLAWVINVLNTGAQLKDDHARSLH